MSGLAGLGRPGRWKSDWPGSGSEDDPYIVTVYSSAEDEAEGDKDAQAGAHVDELFEYRGTQLHPTSPFPTDPPNLPPGECVVLINSYLQSGTYAVQFASEIRGEVKRLVLEDIKREERKCKANGGAFDAQTSFDSRSFGRATDMSPTHPTGWYVGAWTYTAVCQQTSCSQ